MLTDSEPAKQTNELVSKDCINEKQLAVKRNKIILSIRHYDNLVPDILKRTSLDLRTA